MPPLVINIPRIDRPEPATKALVADRRLYLDLDETTLLETGDAAARFLLAPAGGPISSGDVDRLNLSVVDGRVVQGSAKQAAPDADKQSAPSSDKQATPDADKQASMDGDKMATPTGDKALRAKREQK